MGACDPLGRISYPLPDPTNVFNKIMDWMQSNQLVEMADEREERLADDYMVGWDISVASEKKQLGLMAANGWANPEDLEEVKRLSLLRGVEVWDMMISCAKSLKAKAPNQNSLDGQDVLTYLSKLIIPPSTETASYVGPGDIVAGLQGQNAVTSGKNVDEPKTSRAARRKRKRLQSASLQNASPFFVPESTEPATRSKKKEKKLAKMAKRKAARASLIGTADDQPVSPSAHTRPVNPVLHGAATWYGTNAITPMQKVEKEHEAASSSSSDDDGGAALKLHHS
jgi:hypothetical protein